ncbi:hypothetical protein SteCoe_1081 [Stentor coeruleus]|uniref:Uncharacterized protein n=1 Tax=Stentor coeruleus TaxID=5963 RepID=A0A1R2D2L5_9CILI|nr:hypothetical protein SteCoe_1081 [Stentor coeruleus]
MFRGQNEGKKILSNKWNDYNKQIHYQKLKNIKGQVDTGCPATFGTLKRKPKKDQLMEDRFTEIERENRILLEKMSQIVNSKQHHSSPTNRRKSLNTAARKRQNLQIVLENQALLKRLQEKQPSYSVNKWEEERKSTEKRLKNICEFPYTLGGYEETPRKYTEYRTRQNSRSRKIIRIAESVPNNQRKLSPIAKYKAQTVYKKGMSLGDKHFIIEIQKKPDMITILAFDIESPESFCLEIAYNEALQLMGRSENYQALAGMLGVEDGELILIENKFGFEGSGTQRVGKSDKRIGQDEFVVGRIYKKNNSFSDDRSTPQGFDKNEFERVDDQDKFEKIINGVIERKNKSDDDDDEKDIDRNMDKNIIKGNEEKYMDDEDYDEFEQGNYDEKIEDKDKEGDLENRENKYTGFHEDLHKETRENLKVELEDREDSKEEKEEDYQESVNQEKIQINSHKTEESGISKKSLEDFKDDRLTNKKNEDKLVKSEFLNDVEDVEQKKEVLTKDESHKSIEKEQSEKSLEKSASKVSDKIADKELSQKPSEKSIKTFKDQEKSPSEPQIVSEKPIKTITNIEKDLKSENKIEKFSEISDQEFSDPFDPKLKAESPQAESVKSEKFVPETKNEPKTDDIIEENPSVKTEEKDKTITSPEKPKSINEMLPIDIFSDEEEKNHALKINKRSSEDNFEGNKMSGKNLGEFKSEKEENIKVDDEEVKFDDKNIENEGKNNDKNILEAVSKHSSKKSLHQQEEKNIPHDESIKSLNQNLQSYHSSKKSLHSYKDVELDNIPNESLSGKRESFKEEVADFGHSESKHLLKSEKSEPVVIHDDKKIPVNDEKVEDNIPVSKSESKTSIKKLVEIDSNEKKDKVDIENYEVTHEEKNAENDLENKEKDIDSHDDINKNEKDATDDYYEEKLIENNSKGMGLPVEDENVEDYERVDEAIKKEYQLPYEEKNYILDEVKFDKSYEEKVHDVKQEKLQESYDEEAHVNEEKTTVQPHNELIPLKEKSDKPPDQSKPHDEENNEFIKDKNDENYKKTQEKDENIPDDSENKIPDIENIYPTAKSEEKINDLHEQSVEKDSEKFEVPQNEELNKNTTETKNESETDFHKPQKLKTTDHLQEESKDENSPTKLEKNPHPSNSNHQNNPEVKTDNNPNNLIDPKESLLEIKTIEPIPELVNSITEDPQIPPYTINNEKPSETPTNPNENTKSPSP